LSSGTVRAAMGPLVEINLIVQRELLRTVRSVKGVILGVITLIGAGITAYICTWIEQGDRAAAGAATNQAFIEMQRQQIEKVTGDPALAATYSTVPESLLLFLKVTIWLGPLLIALLGFDTMSGDLQHRSVRFWAIRSRRWSFFTAKFVALWATVALITFALNVLAGSVSAIRGYVTVGQLLTWGVRFWLTSLPILAAWAALAAFISALFRTPILALLTTFGTFFVMWLFGLGGWIARRLAMQESRMFKPMSWYEYLYPNGYDEILLAPQASRVFIGLGILLGFSLLLTFAGSALFMKRDV
jgi:ABC-2 type transport system permease protein